MDKILENMFFRLFARKLSGSATAEDLEQLDEILEQHPELQFFYHELIKPAQPNAKSLEKAEQSFTSDVMKMQLSGVWDHHELPPEKSRRGLVRKIYRIVVPAAAALIIAMLFLNVNTRKTRTTVSNETATTRGSKSTVKLPDGTTVMLNANSRLRYDETFKKNNREVTLEGEAYFDVAHDASSPFIIHTNNADIKVLGTTFNVRSMKNGYFETALIKGKVSVSLNDLQKRNFVLEPGEKLMVGEEGRENATPEKEHIKPVKIDHITKVDSLIAETSWTQDQLVFVDKPFAEIAEVLENAFSVKFIFKSEKARLYRYNGVYSDTDLNEILKILDCSKHFKYRREKHIVWIE